MGVNGLGSPNEPAAQSADRQTGVVARGAAPAGTPKEPGIVARGSGAGPAVATLDPVPSDPLTMPDRGALLKHLLETMNKELPNATLDDASNHSTFYWSVVNVLILLTGGNLTDPVIGSTDEAIENATNDLVKACLREEYDPETGIQHAAKLRRASDSFRESVAVAYLTKDFRGPDREKLAVAAVANVVRWIKPHTNETEGNYSAQQLGNIVFMRLFKTNLTPDQTVRVMARLYDEYKKVGNDALPIYTDSTGCITVLEHILIGAKTDTPEFFKAQTLINIYRMSAPKPKENPRPEEIRVSTTR